MNGRWDINRRDFLKQGAAASAGVLVGGMVLGNPGLWAQEGEKQKPPPKPKTNLEDALKVPRGKHSLPGEFPGKSVEVYSEKVLQDGNINPAALAPMFTAGIESLTGVRQDEAQGLFFNSDDVVGIKVNPVGAGLINTRLELVDEIIRWLEEGGVKRENIIIWDRFDYMLADAGYTSERFPKVGIVGLQTMDEAAYMGEAEDDSGWLDENGHHLSEANFDQENYYWADVEAPQDQQYLNQHVFNTRYSYFGKLLTEKLTKIINVPVFKNTGNGISMATKNLGYGAICNTGRLHKPLFFDVCTEVLAFPCIREKLVLNITDGLRGQYEGGPMPNAEFAFEHKRLYFATDPFALDMVCHNQLVEIREKNKVKVNRHPMYTEYLRYAEKLELGIVDPDKTEHLYVEV
jgi:hypothetical protein